MRKDARNRPDLFSRRELLRLGAGAAGLAALGSLDALGPERAQAQSGAFDWKRFKGEKIEVSLEKGT